jgi:hypothetical protein
MIKMARKKYYEVKSGEARLTKNQREFQDEHPEDFEVVTYSDPIGW